MSVSVRAGEPRIKREHLNFNVSKVQNYMLCNFAEAGPHVIQCTHTLTFAFIAQVCVCEFA